MMNRIVSELKARLGEENIDERERIDLLNRLLFEVRDNNFAESIEIAKEALRLSEKLSDGTEYKKGMAIALIGLGQNSTIIGKPHESMEFFVRAERLNDEMNDPEVAVYLLISKATHYWGLGEYNIALETALQGYQQVHHVNNPFYRGWAEYFLGNFYSDLKNNQQAIGYLNRAIDIFSSVDYDTGLGRAYSSLSSVYQRMEDYDKALDLAQRAKEIQEKSGNGMGLSRSLNDIGSIYASVKNYVKAIEYLHKSLELREQISNKQATITTLTELGEVYEKIGKHDEAIEYLKRAEAMATEIDARVKLLRINQALVAVYRAVNEPWKALGHFEKSYELQQYMLSRDNETKVQNLEARFAAEKKKQESEIYRLRNVELKKAYEEIEEKNKEITDSILYARRIQEAILPRSTTLKKIFDKHFVLYKPKDIVSGDFYWTSEKSGKKIIAAVDCTGHGVPGAFMSMVGNSLLNELINEKGYTRPGTILNMLREGVIASLQQTGAEGESKDGMDIALCAFDVETGKLEFAGANNPLWIVSAKGEAKEVRADKQPIGVAGAEQKSFTNHELEIEKGSTYYMFSDGFADQFGGGEGKKMMKKHFRDLLLKVNALPVDERREALMKAFEDWRGNQGQVDDVLVIGVMM
jgi:serine phosphatase RsbU (regulator of sigma subunit)